LITHGFGDVKFGHGHGHGKFVLATSNEGKFTALVTVTAMDICFGNVK
jgi:hypothetical protein